MSCLEPLHLKELHLKFTVMLNSSITSSHRRLSFSDCLLACFCVDDKLPNQRVVNGGTNNLINRRVKTHPRPSRDMQQFNSPLFEEITHSAFILHSIACLLKNIPLGKRKLHAGRNAYLPFTMSIPVTISVTGCSTCSLVFISIK